MPTIQDLASIVIAYKVQGALGTPSTGASAVGIEVRPSAGLSKQVATIESQIIQSGKMKKKPRHGSFQATAQYESELCVAGFDTALEAVLGGTWTASFSKTEAEFTSAAISGTGTLVTFGGGSAITQGFRAGQMAKFTNMSTAGNNAKWFPILAVTATTLTVPSGFLTDQGADSAFTITVAKHLYTADPYTERYFTVEEYWKRLDISKRGTDMMFHGLNFGIGGDQPVTIGLDLTGLDATPLVAGSSPNFTDPVFVDAPSLVLLDGSIFINGASRAAHITSATFGLSAGAKVPHVVGQRNGPDVIIGQFGLAGEFTAVVTDDDDFEAFEDETNMPVFLRFAERESDPADFLSVYMGNMSYGGYRTAVGGDDELAATIPLIGGVDERGTGYLESSMVISSSSA